MAQDDAQARRALTKLKKNQPRISFYCEHYVTGRIPETILRTLCQAFLPAFLHISGPDTQRLSRVETLWRNILQNVRSPAVIDTATNSAACDALRIFLENACSSKVPEIRGFGLSKTTWLGSFEAVFDAFQVGRVRPLTSVLDTLGKILIDHRDQISWIMDVQDDLLRRMMDILFLGQPEQHVKASIYVLKMFLSTVANLHDFVCSINSWVCDNNGEWYGRIRYFGLDPFALKDFAASLERVPLEVRGEWCRGTLWLLLAIFFALIDHDSPRTLVDFLKVFSKRLAASSSNGCLWTTSMIRQPLWTPVLQSFLGQQPHALPKFEAFVLPYLFENDPTGFHELLSSFDFSNAVSEDCYVRQLSLLLSVVHVGHQSGVVEETDLIRILSSALSTVVAVSDYSQYFVRGLLAHPNADVRIKALRLLVVAPATTTPFSQNVLQHLSEHLHYIFGDNDPQNRSEVLSLIRKLIIRLRGGSSTLSKQTIGPPVLLEEPLKCHLDFLIWLLAFLENELGPSVSYQRHIMALTTLYYLMQSGLDSRLPRAELAKLEHNEIEWPFSLRLCPPNVLFSLVNLILDSFEDVRAATSRILRVFFKSVTLSNPAGLVAQQLRHGHGSVISLCNVPDNGRESNLSSSTSPSGMLDLPQDIRRFCIARAENLASQTNRADHADGTGRLYALNYLIAPPSSKSRLVDNMLKKLEEALTRWEDDLPNQLPETTLHGYLLALHYCVDKNHSSQRDFDGVSGRMVLDRIFDICVNVWAKVRNRLCVDSPETSTEDAEENPLGGPKDMLSYSWRALRDSSLLLHAILVSPLFKTENQLQSLGYADYAKAGSLCFQQMSHLRHRGAFFTVAQTWILCCEHVAQSKESSISQLWDLWYRHAKQMIYEQSMRLTRRSAGIPALMAGLLNAKMVEFDAIVNCLRDMAKSIDDIHFCPGKEEQQVDLPQVHALNCLREIFTNSRFQKATEPCIMEMMDLAAKCLACTVWAIRNCGLVLLRACLSKVQAGSNTLLAIDHQTSHIGSSVISADRSSGALEIAIKLLDADRAFAKTSETLLSTPAGYGEPGRLSGVTSERVFAALNLLERVQRTPNIQAEIRRLVFPCLGSTVWMIREQAARIYASTETMKATDLVGTFDFLIMQEARSLQPNELHGRLLCISYLFQTWWSRIIEMDHILRPLADRLGILPDLIRYDTDPSVTSALVDFMNAGFEAKLTFGTQGDEFFLSVFRFRHKLAAHARGIHGQYLRRSLRLNSAFYELATTPCDGELDPGLRLCRILDSLICTDPDAAQAVLHRLSRLHIRTAEVRRRCDNLFIHLFNKGHPEDINCIIINAISSSIEEDRLSYDQEGTDLVWDGVTKLQTQLEFHLPHGREDQGRDLLNGKLRLQANLFRILKFSREIYLCDHDRCRLCLWTTLLRQSAGDEVETPTRLSAAKALSAFKACLQRDFTGFGLSGRHQLAIYSVLYDLLNDDDDETRDVATSVVSHIMSSNTKEITKASRLSALANSKELRHFLLEQFHQDQTLIYEALGRVMFKCNDKHDARLSYSTLVARHSVEHSVEVAHSHSDAVFIEEKQNLCVDDIREIEDWSEMLKDLSLLGIRKEDLRLLGDWVIYGLRHLKHQLTIVNLDGPLGFTSNLEVLTVYMRVVHVARILDYHLQKAQDYALPFDHDTILCDLQDLKTIGKKVFTHPRLLRAIEHRFHV